MSRSLRLGFAVMLAVASLLVTVGRASAATFVYVGNTDSNEIRVLRLEGETGALAPVETVALPGVARPGNSTPMAVSPDRRFLYAAARGEPKLVASYAIDQTTGRLRHVANGPVDDSLTYIATDRTGRFLLGASYGGHKVTVNPIDPPGTVQAPQQVLPNHPNAHSVGPDAANRHVLVLALGNDRVYRFRFDAATGMLAPAAPPAVPLREKAGPRHFAFHPGGKVVYVLAELDGMVYVFDYDPDTGRLAEKQAVSALPPDFRGQPSAADLHVTPDGRFLYGSERTSSTIAGFRVDGDTGLLTPIGSVPTERQPRGFGIDPSGRYLLAVGQRSHRLSSYRIDGASGTLTKLGEYPMGKNPNWIEIVELP